MGGNLGYDVRFVLDATHSVQPRRPYRGPALRTRPRTNLDGEFATIVTTAEVLDA